MSIHFDTKVNTDTIISHDAKTDTETFTNQNNEIFTGPGNATSDVEKNDIETESKGCVKSTLILKPRDVKIDTEIGPETQQVSLY